MLGDLFNSPIVFLVSIISLIVAITIHEFSHALVADRLGDPTPRLQGRLTLNPIAHLDPIGSLLMLIARFGWGKPVVFDPFNLRHPRRDAALISLAGPISNLTLAAILSIALHLFPVLFILEPIIVMNVYLAVFNLVPIHPLDGFKIVGGILPADYAKQWYELEPYGMIFLIFMIFPFFGGVAPLTRFMTPIISFFLRLFLPGVGPAGII